MPKIIADGIEYEVPTFTLGEFRLLKRDFGLQSLGELDLSDPDHLVGTIFVCARRKDPNVKVEAIEGVSKVEIRGDDADEDAAVDPTPSAASSSVAVDERPGDGGASATTPASSGGPDS